MTTKHSTLRRFPAVVLAAALAVCCYWSLPAPGISQEPAAKEDAESRFDFSDTDKCLLCHVDTARMKDHADFCQVAPAEIWSKFDKHSQAFLLLKDKSRELTNRILGFDVREAFTDDEMSALSADETLKTKVQTVQKCLRCHATWPVGSLHPTGDTHQPVVDLKLGVSCQGCHGPANVWNDVHSAKWWRRVSHEAKSSLGFANVRDTAVRAEICTSCHVGSVKEERFVKHEWYAAGHPPLPSFEMATFAGQMPAHWQPLSEKGDFAGRTAASPPVPDGKAERILLRRRGIDIPDAAIKASYEEANFPRPVNRDDRTFNLPRLKETLVSGVVVAKTYSRLLGDYSEQAEAGKATWPELALYDCSACHHELRRQNGLDSRPARRGSPGRPPPAMWTNALLPVALAHLSFGESKEVAALSAELETDLRGLELALTSRPFGKMTDTAAAAKKLESNLDALSRELLATRFDDTAAQQALRALTDTGEKNQTDLRDFHSARQMAWAIREIRKDQEKVPYAFAAEPNEKQMAIEAYFYDDQGRDPLALTLPARQDRNVVENLTASLGATGDYDYMWFRERLKKLRVDLLPLRQ